MANSIIHVGKQNLGNIYVTAGRSKDTFGMYRSNSSTRKTGKLRDKFYEDLCALGRKGLKSGKRTTQMRNLIREYKYVALTEKTIIKILDAYYDCCLDTGIGSKERSKKIKERLKDLLKRKGVRDSVITMIMAIENSKNKVFNRKYLKALKNQGKATKKDKFYSELHVYLTASVTKPVNISDKLSHFCSEYQRDQAYLNRLIKAYKYTTKELLTLKEVNDKYHLKLFKTDIYALDKLK